MLLRWVVGRFRSWCCHLVHMLLLQPAILCARHHIVGQQLPNGRKNRTLAGGRRVRLVQLGKPPQKQAGRVGGRRGYRAGGVTAFGKLRDVRVDVVHHGNDQRWQFGVRFDSAVSRHADGGGA